MPSDIQVHTFDITVNSEGQISVTEDPIGKYIKPTRVQTDDLRMKTIKVLVEMLRDHRLKSTEEYQVLGANLYSILFENHIGEALNRALYEGSSASYLLIKLTFEDQPELSSLPWEYLCQLKKWGKAGGGFLAEQGKLVLVRNLQIDLDPRTMPIPENELPLVILFVAPSPKDEDQVEYLPIMEQLDELQRESNGRIEVYKLFQPKDAMEEPLVTFGKFREWAESLDPHVIHFVGHGKYDANAGGQVAFMGLDFNAHWIKDSRFASELAARRRVRLVFLQACESALSNPYQALSGVALELATKNIPAVVAMQYKIKQHVASQFAQVFYQALMEKNPIEYAVQRGRSQIIDNLEDSFDFGLPVLYMRQTGSLMEMADVQKEEVGGQRTSRTETFSAAAGTVTTGSVACPWCQTSNSTTAKFCGECGKFLRCPNCDHPVLQQFKFCENCRYPLSEAEEGLSPLQPGSRSLVEEPETSAPSQPGARLPVGAERSTPSEAKKQ